MNRSVNISRTLRSGARYFSSSFKDTDVVVCGFARTPIGKIGGAFANVTAPNLGAHVINAALERAGLDKKHVEEAYMGNVVSAGIGQAPSRQAVIYAGLPLEVATTDVNKVLSFLPYISV